MTRQSAALDVWLKFDEPDDEEPTYEANTFRTADGYAVEWYHTAVGQVTAHWFATYQQATDFLEREGFLDFSS